MEGSAVDPAWAKKETRKIHPHRHAIPAKKKVMAARRPRRNHPSIGMERKKEKGRWALGRHVQLSVRRNEGVWVVAMAVAVSVAFFNPATIRSRGLLSGHVVVGWSGSSFTVRLHSAPVQSSPSLRIRHSIIPWARDSSIDYHIFFFCCCCCCCRCRCYT